MDLDTDKIAQEAINAIAKKIKNLKTLNIIVAGKTGVGKSTLINAVFREKLAETGMGKPVTDHMRKITKKGVPLAIYDTRGFELGREVQTEVKREVIDTISKGLATQDINNAIHCIWYCINTASNRVEPEEIEWLKELSKDNQITQVPIIIVLTQSFSKKKADEMRKMLLDENLDVIQVIPVLAEDYDIEDLGIAKSYGLDILIKVMGEALPDELMDTLQNVQIASLEEKKRYAQAAVATASLAAAGAGAAPIPFSDCALLIPTEIGMIASITVIFGFDVNKSIITALLSSTIGAGGATLLGKTVVSNLLKFIPGAGTVAGGAISAGAAGVITAALGEAYIGVMELVFKGDMTIGDIETKKGKDTMTQLFKQQLKVKHN
ncbi:GTP-binding domain protein [Clostridiales bacterium 1_7_47FAA]|uniref:GTPase n=1 Tax=Enterocloster hominis (ex Hitch et al. 2024) TaxID=1917870 RepID=A0ABV1D5C5_9FIRM|nr:GTP-binding domain protein [Clostridiales bacterium 1_7_47FAA]